MKIEGKVVTVFDTVRVNDKFQKRDLVIETTENPQYPQQVIFQAVQDRVHLLEGLQPGDMVQVEFNLRGRAWEPKDGSPTKYFNTLEAWRVTVTAATAPSPTPNKYTGEVEPHKPYNGDGTVGDGEDDLPF